MFAPPVKQPLNNILSSSNSLDRALSHDFRYPITTEQCYRVAMVGFGDASFCSRTTSWLDRLKYEVVRIRLADIRVRSYRNDAERPFCPCVRAITSNIAHICLAQSTGWAIACCPFFTTSRAVRPASLCFPVCKSPRSSLVIMFVYCSGWLKVSFG